MDWLAEAGDDEKASVVLMLEEQVDHFALKETFEQKNTPVSERPRLVMQALKEVSETSQREVITYLSNTDMDYSNLKTHWIANTIFLTGNRELILALANLPGVAFMNLNISTAKTPKPIRGSGAMKSEGGIEPGLAAINAPAMWAMGYTGHQRKALIYDTGTVPDHPALEGRFLPNFFPMQSTWFGFNSELPGNPDEGYHGTHVAGTVLGLDPETADTIGVAPGAYFTSTDVIYGDDTTDDLLSVYQWALNPDGDENTSDDVPDVINNSWGFDIQGFCDPIAAQVLTGQEAAGIANVFSAGNNGPESGTLDQVGSVNVGLVNSFTVAAVNGNFSTLLIADFSSRGPSSCPAEGSLFIKPEVSAPGVNVRSAIAQDGYDFLSGTSMAAPHASGAVLLLKEAFPIATGEEILMALYLSAVDLGEPGEDNTYGMGIIDVFAAYEYLSETYTPTPPQVFVEDVEILEIISPDQDFICLTQDNQVVTPVVSIRNNGTEAIANLTFRSNIGEGPVTVFDYDQSLAGGEVVELTLPEVSYLGSGIKELHIRIDELDDEYDSYNNHAITRWIEYGNPISGANFIEDFSDGIEEDTWAVTNADGEITWDVTTAIQSDGTEGTVAWMNHAEYLQIQSQKDELISPPVDFSLGGEEDYALVYDYYYRKRTSNEFTQDTFAVYLNPSCNSEEGAIELLRKAGEDLYTNSEIEANAFPESADEWVQEIIPLEGLDPDILYSISFETTNRRGNNLLLDNIMITNSLGLNRIQEVEFELFPNPTTGGFTVNSPDSKTIQYLHVFDITGREVFGKMINTSTFQFSQNDMSQGVYLIQITLDTGERGSRKLVVQ